jgi:hypothetical protein
VIVHSLTAQVFLGLAMQRGSTNAAVGAMDAAGAVPAALVGLLLLGDRIRPNLEILAAFGFLATLGSIIALTRYAEPQSGATAERIDKLTRRPEPQPAANPVRVPAVVPPLLVKPTPAQPERPAWLVGDTTAAFELIARNGHSGLHLVDQPTTEVPVLSEQTIELPLVRKAS